MSTPSSIIPVKRRVRRKRRGAPVAPAGPPIAVEYVQVEEDPPAGVCDWVFTDEITLTGTPVGLRVQVGGVWLEPISAVQAGLFEIYCTYDTPETLGGKPFSIASAPSGIVQASRIVVPVSGTISVP